MIKSGRALYRDALHIQQHMHYVFHISNALDGLAGIAAEEGDPVRAARLFGAAQPHCEAVAAPRWRHLDPIYDRDVALARSLLGPEGWQAAWAAGCAMPIDQAVTYALVESAADDSSSDA